MEITRISNQNFGMAKLSDNLKTDVITKRTQISRKNVDSYDNTLKDIASHCKGYTIATAKNLLGDNELILISPQNKTYFLAEETGNAQLSEYNNNPEHIDEYYSQLKHIANALEKFERKRNSEQIVNEIFIKG